MTPAGKGCTFFKAVGSKSKEIQGFGVHYLVICMQIGSSIILWLPGPAGGTHRMQLDIANNIHLFLMNLKGLHHKSRAVFLV